jgi:hypothetical protein
MAEEERRVMPVWVKRCLVMTLSLAAAGPISRAAAAPHQLVFDPSPPVAGVPVAFSWAGPGDDIHLEFWCDDGSYGAGDLRDDGVAEPFSYTFTAATHCNVRITIFSYSGNSRVYQQKYSYSTFDVLP